MAVKILFFARSRELAGVSETSVAVQAADTTESLLSHLLEQFPALKELDGRFVFSLNHEYLERGSVVPLKAGDEVAIIPPISGG